MRTNQKAGFLNFFILIIKNAIPEIAPRGPAQTRPKKIKKGCTGPSKAAHRSIDRPRMKRRGPRRVRVIKKYSAVLC